MAEVTKMEKVVHIRDAVVKTLKVELKTITINQKQMTMGHDGNIRGKAMVYGVQEPTPGK
jgi:hypothetical protein